MIIIAITLVGVILIAQTSTAQDIQIDFTDFCTHFNDRRTFTGTLTKLNEDLEEIGKQLMGQGIFSGEIRTTDDILKKRCTDESTYFNPECLYVRRLNVVGKNNDWKILRWYKAITLNTELPEIYIDLWLMHPLMRGCAIQLDKPLKENDAKTRLLRGLASDNAVEFTKLFAFNKEKVECYNIRNEVDKSCGKNELDAAFCSSLPDIVALVDAFEKVKDEDKTSVKWNAFQLFFVVVKDSNPGVFADDAYPSPQESNQIISKNLEQIFTYMARGQITELKDFLAFIPGLKEIRPACRSFRTLPSNQKNSCLFWKAIIQIRAYLQSLNSPKHGQIQKILNTETDYAEFLRLTEMNRILEVVHNNANALPALTQWVSTEVNKNTNERFKELRTYFQKVESFNREKSNADVLFVKSWLDEYENSVRTIREHLASRLHNILTTAYVAVGADIAEDTLELTLSIVAMCNPLKAIFGGGSITETLKSTQNFAQSMAKIPQLVKITNSFNDLKTNANDIGNRFAQHTNFLENVKNLIASIGTNLPADTFEQKKQTFIDSYNNYDPKVKKPELTAMTTKWEVLIEEACEVISSTHGVGSAAAKAYEGSQGHCATAKVLAAKITETYEEIYDFQFQLIEDMATYVRATTAQYAASEIVSGLEDLSTNQQPDTVSDFKTLSLVSFISYKINIWQIMETYCDILEYKEGGRRPTSVCKGTDSDVTTLASYVSPTCRNIEAYKDVPISSSSDKAFMNLTDLYDGRPITFKIPNSDWLVENNWILQQDKDSSITVKKFEVYLPTQSLTQRTVRVSAKVTGNKLSASSDTSYVIVPNKEFIFEYLEGSSDQPCKSQALDNPYGQKLSKLCPLNVDENNCLELLQRTPLFPSVYSNWKITVSGYESTPFPSIANDDFKLKVGVKLCILNQASKDKAVRRGKKKLDKMLDGSDRRQREKQERKSCQNNSYYSMKLRRCKECPKGSKSDMDGYFCAKTTTN